jgi:glycosyltransferase involved in cell wall biosynthesis
MPDILMFKGVTEKIFIQAGEPRDEKLLRRFLKNSHPVPIAANWWIDSRIFKPDNTIEKDIDIIMVSSWLKLKRHYLLFKALKELKQQGKALKCVLVGYPIDMKKEDIVALAKEYGVLEQIEIHEWLKQTEIAKLYQRAKLNLLLSTREGFNRSVIEGFHANVPCLIREGFNFGHKYNYINNKTGGYYTDGSLHNSISDALDNIEKFSPNDWIIQNKMTAQDAAAILEKEIYNTQNKELAVKVSGLDGMEYWNEEDNEKYIPDYKVSGHFRPF